MRIIIDNGHGINTPGKRSPEWEEGTHLSEWKWTRDIAELIEIELSKYNIPVHRIVKEKTDVPLWERCLRVNQLVVAYGAENCLLVSLHVNTCNGKAKGWEVHTFKGRTVSDIYATVFWKEAEKRLNNISRIQGNHSSDDFDWDGNFAILRDTICPAVLTENLFMDNRDDCEYLLSEAGKKEIVDIHVSAIQKIVALQKHFN